MIADLRRGRNQAAPCVRRAFTSRFRLTSSRAARTDNGATRFQGHPLGETQMKLFRLREVRRGSPVRPSGSLSAARQGGLGASPPVTKGWAGGDQNVCFIGTTLVEKTSPSLNSYTQISLLTCANACATLSAVAGEFPVRVRSAPSVAAIQGKSLKECVTSCRILSHRCPVRITSCHIGVPLLQRGPQLNGTKCYKLLRAEENSSV